MVERSTQSLDAVFGSLADPIRRDILTRVSSTPLSVNDIAAPYDVSLAAVSKHLKVLERAELVIKERRGKQQFVRLAPEGIKTANDYLEFYKSHFSDRIDSLAEFIEKENDNA
jgi:DNA-binding transcriptional ArsR family regulator